MSIVGKGTRYVSGFSPTSIPGCALWLDGIDPNGTGTPPAVGSTVSTWVNKSSATNNLTLTAGTTTSVLDGTRRVVNFPLGALMTSASTFVITTSSAIFIVTKVTTVESPASMMLAFSNIAPAGEAGDYSIRFTSSGLNGTAASAGNANDIGNNNYYVNGNFNPNFPLSTYTSDYTIIDTVSPGAGGTTAMTLSSTFGSTRRFNGQIAEVLIYPDGVTPAQRQAVEGYLSAKWSIYLPNSTTFLPTTIAGCSLWLDATDPSNTGVQPANGTAIASWVDKSGTGNNALQTNASYRPTFSNDGGVSAISFASAAAQHLLGGPLLTSTSYSLFFVARSVTSNALQFLFFDYKKGVGGTGQNYVQHVVGDTGAIGVDFLYAETPQTIKSITNSPTVSTTRFMSSLIDSPSNTTSNFYVNGNSYRTTFTNGGIANISTDATGYALGCIRAPTAITSLTFNGFMYEVIAYTTELTSTQRQQVEGYLARKWSVTPFQALTLPSTHPYRTLRPVFRPFQPIDISGCQLWLDATDPSGNGAAFTNGAAISAWVDKSGNGRTLTTTKTGTGAVTFSTYGGVPSILINSTSGNTAYMRVVSAVDLTNFTFYILARCQTAVWNQGVFIAVPSTAADYTSGDGFGFYIDSITSNRDRFYATAGSPTLAMVNSNAASGGDAYPFRMMSYTATSNGNISSWYNGNTGTTYSSGTNRTSTATGFGFGFSIDGSNGTPGNLICVSQLSEVLVYNTVLSASQRQQVETYLANKWALRGNTPAGHYARLSPALSLPFIPIMFDGCTLWLDATDRGTITLTGSNVTQLIDKSPAGLSLTGTTGFTWPNNTFGGSYPSFLNVNGGLGGTNAASCLGVSTLNLSTPFTFFAVIQKVASASDGYLLDSGPSGSGRPYIYGSAVITPWGSGSFQMSNASVLSMIWTSGSAAGYHNGTINFTGSTSLTSSGLTIGNRFSVNESWPGHICEVLIFTSAFTTFQRQRIEGYLAWKWGLVGQLPTGHPYKGFKP